MKPYRVRSSHIARFSSGVCSTVAKGATVADNAGGTAGSGGGGGMGADPLGGAGGARSLFKLRTIGRPKDCNALGPEGVVLIIELVKVLGPRFMDGGNGTSPKVPACEAVAGGVGREVVGLIKEEEDEASCCCVIDVRILADGVGPLFAMLTSVKLVGRGSWLALEFCGDPA